MMNWQTFKETLTSTPDTPLQFEYEAGKYVDASYHITEIKQVQITSVDCGGQMNAWTEVVVQLWVPEGKEEEQPMLASKATKIIDIVEKSVPMHPLAPVKIEYGDAQFPTRQLLIEHIGQEDEGLLVSLVADKTQCKAQDRGGDCAPKAKPKIKLTSLAGAMESDAGASCSPESGCC